MSLRRPLLPLFLLLAALPSLRAFPAAADGLPVCTAPEAQWSPRVLSDPAGGAWVLWLDRRSTYSIDLYGCTLDPSGAPSTSGTDQGETLTWITCLKADPVLVPDGGAGALAIWSDHRCGATNDFEVYAMRLGPDGLPDPGWPTNGAPVHTGPGWQGHPAIATDGAAGAFAVWVDREVAPARLFLLHLLANGVPDPAWPAEGLLLDSDVPSDCWPRAATDDAGGVYLAWDTVTDGDGDVRLGRFTSAGLAAPGWPASGLLACDVPGPQHGVVLAKGAAGVALAWEDERGPVAQVYACRFLPDGSRAPGWPLEGALVAPGAFAKSGLVGTGDGADALLLAWSEDRGTGSGSDLYVERLDSTGVATASWPASGAPATAAPGIQRDPALLPAGDGGAYLAWTDERDSLATGLDVYVQRLDPDGTVHEGWPADGASLCQEPGDQREVQLASDGSAGAFAVWTDGRDSSTTGDDIAARLVQPTGPAASRPDGISATHHDGQTFLRWAAPLGHGFTYRVYESGTPIQTQADLDAASYVGSVGDSTACDLRMSHLLGETHGYRTTATGPELPPGDGLFVRTVGRTGASYYAVTITPGTFEEDRRVTPGENSLVSAVAETTAVPRPVYQRSIPVESWMVEIWTLWTWNADLPGFPAMASRASMAFANGLVRGQPADAPLVVRFHPKGGSLLSAVGGAFIPGEWVLAFDDYLPNGQNTFWFGYHPDYDVMSAASPPPLTGAVVDYTARRVDWTLDWVRRTFPIDTTRVITYGYSMGAMGATQLALRSPGKIAGVMSVIGQFDYSFETDPFPNCWFNPGGPFRDLADQIWGLVATDLPDEDGKPVFDVLNGTRLVADEHRPDVPPMMVFNGRRDLNVGWEEKVRFWQAMRAHHRGGYFFWDDRNHGVDGAVWIPMQAPGYLDRFRTDRSFAALSNADVDGDPGDGSPATGDTVGTWGGAFEWTTPVDTPGGWSTTLTLRDLVASTGTIAAPESALVDVTPRRVQNFSVAPFAPVPWRVVRVADQAEIASGLVTADSLGVVTVPGVRVLRAGSRLDLGGLAVSGAPSPAAGARFRLSCPSPVRSGAFAAVVEWGGSGPAELDVLDVAGRRVARLFAGSPERGPARYTLRRGLAPGLYFLRARSGGEERVRRVVVLR